LTERAQQQLTAIDQVLPGRDRRLSERRPLVEETLTVWGPDGAGGFLGRQLCDGGGDAVLGSASGVYLRPDLQEAVVELELPGRDVIPPAPAFRYVKSTDTIRPEPFRDAEVKLRYGRLVGAVSLRALADLFELTPDRLVESAVVNGHIKAIDAATGRETRPCVVSVSATRGAFAEIRLDAPELDPIRCLREYLNAIVSPHPFDLEAVRPVMQFDHTKYKFVEGLDVLAGLDSRLDLLALTPTEFEHLIRRLVEAMGMQAWVTQASNDDGVDAVAFNDLPLIGGECVIQAKRYSKLVRHEAVQALAGVIDDKRASRGILVTTSWVGQKSRDFAHRHGRIEIHEGRQLKHLLRQHLDIDALISLPVTPPGWSHSDIA
jgi:restriction system protein